MAAFAAFTKTKKSENLVVPSVTFEARRYLPKHKRWSVILRSGWGHDYPKFYKGLSRSEARSVANAFMEGL